VQKWGNSLGIRIPKSLAERCICAKAPLSNQRSQGVLTIRPKRRRKYTPAQLLAGQKDRALNRALDRVGPVGGTSMSYRTYLPNAAIWFILTFPPRGHEMADRHYALVISAESYNRRSRMAIVCPITSRVRGWPFEVELPTGLHRQNAAMRNSKCHCCRRVRQIDYRERETEFVAIAPQEVVEEVLDKLMVVCEENDSSSMSGGAWSLDCCPTAAFRPRLSGKTGAILASRLDVIQHVHEIDVAVVGAFVGAEVFVDVAVGPVFGAHVVEVVAGGDSPPIGQELGVGFSFSAFRFCYSSCKALDCMACRARRTSRARRRPRNHVRDVDLAHRLELVDHLAGVRKRFSEDEPRIWPGKCA